MYRKTSELKKHKWNSGIFGGETLPEEFVDSIRSAGIRESLVIKDDGTVISGHKRLQAARELGIQRVPVRVESYGSEIEEREAFIDFNRYREKTFSQKMTEAEFIEVTEWIKARGRQGHGQTAPKKTLSETFHKASKGRTTDAVAKKTGLGSGRNYSRAKEVWNKAQDGVRKAEKLVDKIDKGEMTIGGAYNRLKKEKKKPHVSNNSGENEWYTPSLIMDAVHSVFGTIDLDPASTEEANEVVQAKKIFTTQDNGLELDWAGKVFLNPPYSVNLLAPFIDKTVASVKAGQVEEAIVLVNNATETKWFSRLAEVADRFCFLKSRVKFWKPDTAKAAPLQGQCVAYIGSNGSSFWDGFASLGIVVEVIR